MSSIRRRLPIHVLLLVAGALSLFPLYWLFLTSLSPTQYVVRVPPEVVPRELTVGNYQRLFETTPIVRWLVNTVVIAGVITAFHLLFDSMAGYAFAKRRFPGKDVMFWLIVSTLTVPAQVTLIPVFFILRALGLLDTYPGVILPGLADVFGVFLMKQFIQTLPTELEHAARVDGASEWQVYRHIIVPLSRPALAVLAIFTFQRYWNAFIFPLVILRDPAKYPVQVGLATLQGEFNTDYGMLMTGAAVAALPIIAVFFAFQRQFVEGIRIGGVKG
ncbi:MAG: carbohydrate ABC transporter permease [Chloroflexi bacterium]|nr:MAG: carbohydrate ABC transporter permease [Chloroflexota bacterium]